MRPVAPAYATRMVRSTCYVQHVILSKAFVSVERAGCCASLLTSMISFGEGSCFCFCGSKRAVKLGGVCVRLTAAKSMCRQLWSCSLCHLSRLARISCLCYLIPCRILPVAARPHTLTGSPLLAPSSTGTCVNFTSSTNSLDTFTNPHILTCA